MDEFKALTPKPSGLIFSRHGCGPARPSGKQ